MTSSTTRWVVRGMVVAAAAGALLLLPPAEVPTDTTGPGPGDVAETVAPPTHVSAPPVDSAERWVVFAVGTTYRDEQGRTYRPPLIEAVCVPAADLASGVAESAYALWTVPVPPDAPDVEQGESCPVP